MNPSPTPTAVPTTVPAESEEPTALQCMEVWGGNHAAQSVVALFGLDVCVSSRPHGADSGGDIHYVSSCATGRINRLLLADVSGHGAEVADVARQLRDLMRRFVNHLDQRAFVRSLNREFAAITQVGRFATAVVTTYWSPTSTLEICNAGHPRPLWYRAREDRWDWIDPEAAPRRGEVANVPLGVLSLARYDTRRIRLDPKDRVLLYTDALIETPGPDGEFLGEEGLLECVRQLPSLPPEEFLKALQSVLESHRGGTVPDDDETLMLFTPNARAPRMTVAERVNSIGRMMGALTRTLRPGGDPMPWPDAALSNVAGFFLPGLFRRHVAERNEKES